MTMAEQGQGGCRFRRATLVLRSSECSPMLTLFIDLARVPSNYRLVVLGVYTGKGRHAISQTVSIVRI